MYRLVGPYRGTGFTFEASSVLSTIPGTGFALRASFSSTAKGFISSNTGFVLNRVPKGFTHNQWVRDLTIESNDPRGRLGLGHLTPVFFFIGLCSLKFSLEF